MHCDTPGQAPGFFFLERSNVMSDLVERACDLAERLVRGDETARRFRAFLARLGSETEGVQQYPRPVDTVTSQTGRYKLTIPSYYR